MRKEISIIISAVFMITLVTSSSLSSVNVAVALVHGGQDFLYSVSVSSTLVRLQQGDFGTYDVKVLRGSAAGQFSVILSLVNDSSLPKSAISFDPPILNFVQGQTVRNSTLKINSQDLKFGTNVFRVQATTQPPAIPDKALSNPATLIVSAAGTRQSANSLTDSESQSSSSSESLPSDKAQRNMPESLQTKLNNPPIAKAGQDQVIKEGERVVLDGSASTDPDKTPLSFSWEQISPRQQKIKLDSSETSNKVSFVLPDVDRDTIFRFKLVVKDGNGGQAADSINILARNVEASASPESPSPRQEEQQNQEPATQEIAPNSDSGLGASSNQNATRTENHSPTAEAQQTLSTLEGKALSISLKGNDPDKDDKISFVILTNPLHGTIAGFDKTSGLMTFVPSSAFTGQDRLAYSVVDSRGAKSNDGLVVIMINAVDSQTPSSQSSRPGLSPDTSPSNVSSSLLSPSPSIPNQNTGSPM